MRLSLQRVGCLQQVRPALPSDAAEFSYACVNLFVGGALRERVPISSSRFTGKDQDRLPLENRVEIDAGVCDERGRVANGLVAKVEVPSRLADGLLKFGVGVLAFGEHARPERHVAEIPSGRKGLRVPGVSPHVTNAVAGTALERAPGIDGPCSLGLGVVVELDGSAVPGCLRAFGEPRVVFTAATGTVGVQRGVATNPVRVGEVGVFERGSDDGCPTLAQVVLQRFDWRRKLILLDSDVDQEGLERVDEGAVCGALEGLSIST